LSLNKTFAAAYRIDNNIHRLLRLPDDARAPVAR